MMKPKKRVMLIGSVDAGKSTLLQALFGDELPARKTQSLEYRDWIIDTPGEYTENPMYYRSLMATSFEAGLLLIVQDATARHIALPPGFAGGFPIPAMGVITKLDHPHADLTRAESLIRVALPEGELWHTSSMTKHNIDALRERLTFLLR
ncbi:EutP/PduV family microcompartment system protein [Paenibacillus guangzhouensis]|uniref:EutP/PduV family microcompartment system protein n=1 Tax=Paenibacillus guangzhouensis TaxID=1473112 RepID=UPI001266CDC9|nr:EutP/PduV family microcompartment system protein [Paenibacillus guangzhouensis]